MAMFLSRIKKALNLGTKSITQNGTYNASSDGYDGYSSVEVNVAGVIPTPITPSNASPAALTSGTAVSPTGNGYAIESYSLANPEEGTRMTSGNFYKATDNGLIIDDIETLAAGSGTDDTIVDGKNYHAVGSGIAIQGFTSITPSNSSPVSLSSGEYYKPTASGKAIASYAEVAPSNANPPDMYTGSIYKIKTRNGLLISTASLVAPSDTNPPQLLVNDTYYRINGASGYLYSTVQPKVKTGSQTTTAGTVYTITCGFQPKKIFIYAYESANKYISLCYDSDVESTYSYGGWRTTSSSVNANKYNVTSSTSNGSITDITSTGFKWKGSGNFNKVYYVAIG